MTPLEIIAKKMIRRSSEDGSTACGHRIGESDASAILLALGSAGYTIATKAENERLRAIELAAIRCVEDGDISKLMTTLAINQQESP